MPLEEVSGQLDFFPIKRVINYLSICTLSFRQTGRVFFCFRKTAQGKSSEEIYLFAIDSQLRNLRIDRSTIQEENNKNLREIVCLPKYRRSAQPNEERLPVAYQKRVAVPALVPANHIPRGKA